MLAKLRERLTRGPASKRKAEVFYGKVVAAARQPSFFGLGRVPDTPEGRFELVALHLFLVAERVKGIVPGGQDVARHLIEAFVTDMDDCMREMGVGDLTVPKRVKRAAAGFYERSGTYRAALAAPASPDVASDPLAAAAAQTFLQLSETISVPPPESTTRQHPFAAELAHYIRATRDRLASASDASIDAGDVIFAQPPAPLNETF